MEITYDLYKMLDLDRSWNEKEIRAELKKLTKLWTGRENACNDKVQAMYIDKIKKLIEEAFKTLTKSSKREEYDKCLDKAYKEGKINDEKEQEMLDIFEKAKEYYEKGNIKLATEYAKEAVDGKVNKPEAYDLLARCYYDNTNYQEAINTIDRGLNIFENEENLQWLGIRIAITGVKDYDLAQERINKMMEVHPSSMLAFGEQINLHLYKNDEDVAFEEINKYIENNPNDDSFKKNISYVLDAFSNNYYYFDESDNSMYIADKYAYEKCVKICSKAYEIYQDEHTKNKLEEAEFYGRKSWDSWNIESIKTLTLYGIILLLAPPVGIFFLAVDALLIYFSFRPYWQINKTYVTGERGGLEGLVSSFGDMMARLSYRCFRLLILFFKTIFRIVFWIVGGAGL